MLRDLLTQKVTDNLDTPEHVNSENIKLKIGHRPLLYQLVSNPNFSKKKKKSKTSNLFLERALLGQQVPQHDVHLIRPYGFIPEATSNTPRRAWHSYDSPFGAFLVVMERASKHQAWAELSRATLGLSFSSPRASKIKLFKPGNSKNQAFQALPKQTFFSVFYSKDTLFKYFYSWRISVSSYFLQLNWFLYNQIKKKLLLF
jgi:hypothetical protein